MNRSGEQFIKAKLQERIEYGLLRKLRLGEGLIDFCSNDYLGYARNNDTQIDTKGLSHGSTGSRLLNGNSLLAEQIEQELAEFHEAEAGLIYNSGYDANVGLFSCLPQRGDTVIYDELIHASIRDGIRLSFATNFSFFHNDLNNLENRLKLAKGNVYVVVESVYSMDGDFAPLQEINALCKSYQANLIVDEAHATGIFGKNGRGRVQELNLQNDVFARVHTFGKALGCHGAIVVGSNSLRDYQINFSRSFIYTTALPPSSLIQIKSAYQKLKVDDLNIHKIKSLIFYFIEKSTQLKAKGFEIIESQSPIQCIVIPGNEQVKSQSEKLRLSGFDVRPILSPTVKKGRERLRICLHAFNDDKQLDALISLLLLTN